MSRFAGGGFKGTWPSVNLLALNWFSSSWVSLLSGVNKPSAASLPAAAEVAGAVGAPNTALVFPKLLLPLLSAAAGAPLPDPLPNPVPVFAEEEEKLKAEAEPKPEEAGGWLVVGAAKENVEAEGVEAEPKPMGGWAGAAVTFPKPDEDDGAPNPVLDAAKLKLLAVAVAGAPKPTGQIT